MLYHYKYLPSILDNILSRGHILAYYNELKRIHCILFELAIRNNKKNKKIKFNRNKIYYTSLLIKLTYSNMLPKALDLLEKGLNLNFTFNVERADYIIIYGRQLTLEALKDLMLAYEYKKPVFFCEDNFFAYFDGCENNLLSISFDSEGFYFDCKYAGIRNRFLNSNWKIKKNEKLIAQYIIDSIVNYEISKFNIMPDRIAVFEDDNKKTKTSLILVIDQKRNDASVFGANANLNTFRNMVKDAVDENPDSLIVVKSYAKISKSSNQKKGYYDKLQPHPRILKYEHDVNPIALIKLFDKVYTVSSQMGLEAVMCNKTVYCYGQSFYNGWGFTIDRSNGNYARNKKRTLQEIVYMYYSQHAYYYNPTTEKLCDVKEIINYIKEQKNEFI